MVADYCHNDFEYCLNMDCYTFKKLMVNAFIDKMRQTKEGRDYLEECWILTQTDMDTKGIKKIIGKGE